MSYRYVRFATSAHGSSDSLNRVATIVISVMGISNTFFTGGFQILSLSLPVDVLEMRHEAAAVVARPFASMMAMAVAIVQLLSNMTVCKLTGNLYSVVFWIPHYKKCVRQDYG